MGLSSLHPITLPKVFDTKNSSQISCIDWSLSVLFNMVILKYKAGFPSRWPYQEHILFNHLPSLNSKYDFLSWVALSVYALIAEELYSVPQKSWPLLPCISYESRGHDFCDTLYIHFSTNILHFELFIVYTLIPDTWVCKMRTLTHTVSGSHSWMVITARS